MTIEQAISLTTIQTLSNKQLLRYMADLGVSTLVCKKYLREIKLYNRLDKKHFLTLGMLNENEGYELQNEFYSGWFNGERDVSVIRGRQYPARSLHVFLNMNDFLAMVAREKEYSFHGDALILHTYDLLHKVPPYLYQYKYKHLRSWMPNNDYGTTAIDTLSAYCLAEPGLEHQPMNRFFSKHETIREWCAAQTAITKG